MCFSARAIAIACAKLFAKAARSLLGSTTLPCIAFACSYSWLHGSREIQSCGRGFLQGSSPRSTSRKVKQRKEEEEEHLKQKSRQDKAMKFPQLLPIYICSNCFFTARFMQPQPTVHLLGRKYNV